MAGKLGKRHADAVFAAINSQCLSPLEKAFTPFLRALLGLRAPLEKAVLHRFPICSTAFWLGIDRVTADEAWLDQLGKSASWQTPTRQLSSQQANKHSYIV